MKRDGNVQIFPVTGNKHNTLPMHTNTAPFDNNDVRLALKFAINREELLKKIIKGQGEVGNDTPVGPQHLSRHGGGTSATAIRSGEGQASPEEGGHGYPFGQVPCRQHGL